MAILSVQNDFDIHHGLRYLGVFTRPNAPRNIDGLPIHVPAGATRSPRPGDAVYWDPDENQVALCTTAAHAQQALGILTYTIDRLQDELEARPAGANSRFYISYKDNEAVPVLTCGHIIVTAGEDLKYSDILIYDHSDNTWKKRPNPTVTGNTIANAVTSSNAQINLYNNQVPVVYRDTQKLTATTGDLIEVSVGFGIGQ